MTRLEAIKKRLAEATPGPWKHYITGGIGEPIAHEIYDTVPTDDRMLCRAAKEHDGHFIAHAPADLAALLAVVEAAVDLAENDFLVAEDARGERLRTALAPLLTEEA